MAKIVAKKPVTISLVLVICITIVAALASFWVGSKVVRGEQAGSSPDSGVTSRVKSLYTTLQSAGYGSDTNTPNWGTYWNRISTASQFPQTAGTATTADVLSSKTFYNSNRTKLIGTAIATSDGVCSTQQYHDSYGAPVTETTNCTVNINWTVTYDGISGTDKKDPKSGLIWSRPLLRSGSSVLFTIGVGSIFSWDASGTNNVAVGNKTASQLCSERGDGWRLPSQKELAHAYIDGSNFNLISPAYNYWSRTENSTGAFYTDLSTGLVLDNAKSSPFYVRCVR